MYIWRHISSDSDLKEGQTRPPPPSCAGRPCLQPGPGIPFEGLPSGPGITFKSLPESPSIRDSDKMLYPSLSAGWPRLQPGPGNSDIGQKRLFPP